MDALPTILLGFFIVCILAAGAFYFLLQGGSEDVSGSSMAPLKPAKVKTTPIKKSKSITTKKPVTTP